MPKCDVSIWSADMIRAFFQRRREIRDRIRREARNLTNWMGELAHAESLQRAREARGRRDREETAFWMRVAAEIATRTKEEAGRRAAAEARMDPPPAPDPKRREIMDRLVELSRGLGTLETGRGDPQTMHEIGVIARQIFDFAGRTPELERAVAEVVAAFEALPNEGGSGGLQVGVSLSAIEEANRALRRLREVALKKGGPRVA